MLSCLFARPGNWMWLQSAVCPPAGETFWEVEFKQKILKTRPRQTKEPREAHVRSRAADPLRRPPAKARLPPGAGPACGLCLPAPGRSQLPVTRWHLGHCLVIYLCAPSGPGRGAGEPFQTYDCGSWAEGATQRAFTAFLEGPHQSVRKEPDAGHFRRNNHSLSAAELNKCHPRDVFPL